jgi:hypothetical protein
MEKILSMIFWRTMMWRHRRDQAPIPGRTLSPVASHGLIAALLVGEFEVFLWFVGEYTLPSLATCYAKHVSGQLHLARSKCALAYEHLAFAGKVSRAVV